MFCVCVYVCVCVGVRVGGCGGGGHVGIGGFASGLVSLRKSLNWAWAWSVNAVVPDSGSNISPSTKAIMSGRRLR